MYVLYSIKFILYLIIIPTMILDISVFHKLI